MMPKHSLSARLMTALLAVSLSTLAACDSGDGGTPGGTSVAVVQIVTVPNAQTLTNLIPATTRQMLGVPTNEAGNWVDKDVTFSSSNNAVFTVSATGLVTAVVGGNAYLRATAGGRTDSVLIAVRYPVATVTVSHPALVLRREGTQQLTATTIDTQGATVTGRTITWTSDTPANVTVSATGLAGATAAAADASTATITATVNNAADLVANVAGTRLITVNGDAVVATVVMSGGSGIRGNTGTTQLTASARSGLNNVIPAPITWTSNSAPRATVDAAGLVTWAGGVGAVTITATATGAGAGGSSPAGTAVFEVLTALVTGGVSTPLAIGASTAAEFALNGTGMTSFVVATSGGTGDVDLLAVPNGTTGYGLDNSAFTTGTAGATGCLSGAAGNGESCGRNFGAQAFWRIRFWAFGATAVSTNYTATLTP